MEQKFTGNAPTKGFAVSEVRSVCEKFEKELHAGASPKLTAYLEEVPDTEKSKLFEELLVLKLAYRQSKEELPTLEEYIERFPQFRQAAQRAFAHPSVAVGEYRLVSCLGKGGMGMVYLAIHSKLRKRVAVKVLAAHRTEDAKALARFRKEMQMVGQLEHPNIVRAMDAGEAEGTHFLVMEFIRGWNLDQLIAMQGRLPVGVACEAIRQAAEGLAYAEMHQIVHRDIKPSNLMVNAQGVVKLLDLGLATLSDTGDDLTTLTEAGSVLGTVDYMAPEQWRNPAAVDGRADIYSLGCTLYHLLVGRPPYSDSVFCNTRDKKMMAHVSAPTPVVTQELPNCPPGVAEVLQRMMAKEPQDRYPSAIEVADALAPFSDEAALVELVRPLAAQHNYKEGTTSSTRQRAGSDSGARSRSKSSKSSQSRSTDGRHLADTLEVGPHDHSPKSRIALPLWLAIAFVGLALLVGGTFGLMYLNQKPPSVIEASGMAQSSALATLPDLQGGWWFEESPWLTPGIRLAWLNAWQQGETEFDGRPLAGITLDFLHQADVPTIYDTLQPLAQSQSLRNRLSSSEKDLLGQLYALPIDSAVKDYKEKVSQIAARLNEASTNLPATELHLRAVVCHYAAQWEPAEKYYRQALAAYETEKAPEELLALCHSDLSRMLVSQHRDGEAVVELGKTWSLATDFSALAFQIDTLCQQAIVLKSVPNFKAAHTALTAADAIAEKLPPQHPLRAYIAEQRGWLLLEDWRLSEAIAAFKQAASLRLPAAGSSSNALRGKLWAEQGQFMALHFWGKQDEARAGYAKLLEEINQFLQLDTLGGQELTEREKSEIGDRRTNIYERMGDCDLFGKSKDYVTASHALDVAIRHGELDGFDADRRAPELIRLRFLHSLTSALSGNLDRARSSYQAAERKIQEDNLVASQHKVFELTSAAANAMLVLKDDDPANDAPAYDTLRKTLTHETVTRRNLELLLLISEILLDSQTLDQNSLGEVARSVLRITKPLRKQPESRDYLQRYLLSTQTALQAALTNTPNFGLAADLAEVTAALAPTDSTSPDK